MNTNNLQQLIQNLRRGDHLAVSKTEFFNEMNVNMPYWCNTLSLRWLVSVADTYIDHGTPTEARNAMVISTYFNMVKIADTSRLLSNPCRDMLPRLLDDVVFMYDEVNSLKITTDDMPNILFYRINELMQPTPALQMLFEEIKRRLAHHSQTMQIAGYHKGFYNKIFFEGRRNYKNA
ncbi:MAG: hypothetical protein OEY01_11055 [Desulfobulbaceae bacterium]|nr:hypothetical protein [Desulfobulbaceae bacterium]